MLAAAFGTSVYIKASGKDEKEAINEIEKLFNSKFGEKNLNHVYLDGSRSWDRLIIAKAWVNMYFSGLEVRYSEISESEITSEIGRLRRAIKMLEKDFEDISKSFKNSKTGDFENLLDSQRLIVNDQLLVGETEKRIGESLVNAECALVRQLDFIVEQFSKISNPYFQERKIDVEQIVGQLLKKLSLLDKIEKPRKPDAVLADKKESWVCLSDQISINEISKFITRGS